MTILDKIIDYKIKEVALRKAVMSIDELSNTAWYERTCISYVDSLESDSPGIIAEFKRRSPSRQNINLDAKIEDVSRAYVKAGASALSILTDEHFFGGSDDFLKSARELNPSVPILRKDFIIDEYQIHEAKSLGADIVLLIAEVLSKDDVKLLSGCARSLGLEVLLEMHTIDQVDKCCGEESIIGVNNRDLKTFQVDFDRSKKLYDMLPADMTKIAESGLSDPATLVMLHKYGFKGFLIGEQFMKQEDPGKACEQMISQFNDLRHAD